MLYYYLLSKCFEFFIFWKYSNRHRTEVRLPQKERNICSVKTHHSSQFVAAISGHVLPVNFLFPSGVFCVCGGGGGERGEFPPPHAKSENSYILGGAFPPKMEDYELLNIIILNW
jgi:hypothetical protein